jgi:3-oxoacyl-(acyl-carrier-protein) synthase
MANSQLAELVAAKGPNLHVNAACAGTTAAIAVGCDWIRTGRAKRVVVIAADNPSSERLMPLIGTGFLALGAATTKRDVREAALPFDLRRNGMLLGAGAVGLVLEADDCAATASRIAACRPGALPLPHSLPLATILAVRHANSAYHASAIGVKHAGEVLDALLCDVLAVHGLDRKLVASSLLYMSHETFTHARGGGCAGAEMTALRHAFGDDARQILISNTKGMTGHPMGVCFEDVVSVAALATGLAPPVVNHKQADPLLGDVRLSRGGPHTCQFALHFAAGFGSQVAYILYRK